LTFDLNITCLKQVHKDYVFHYKAKFIQIHLLNEKKRELRKLSLDDFFAAKF